jgi:mannose-6-phosphate isomerase-like protein (cupin superfamily)
MKRPAKAWAAAFDREEIIIVGPGTPISISFGTEFQVRCDGAVPLSAICITTVPRPGGLEAVFVRGAWQS